MLTEKQLLRMPAKDYMNKQQLEFFEARLDSMREELEVRQSEERQELASKEREADELDQAAAEERETSELKLRGRELRLLSQVYSALERIKEGAYGFCEVSGDPIGVPRLLARPVARLSIDEKERQEKLKEEYYD